MAARSIAATSCLAIAASVLALNAAPAAALSKHVFSSSFAGSGSSALKAPTDVAVDQQTGDVYVTDPPRHRIEKFGPAGEFILTFGLEVNETTGGNVCAAGEECKSGASGTEAAALTDPEYLAVDDSGIPGQQGDVYVGNPGIGAATNVQKFNPQGELVTSWAEGGQLDGSTASSFSGHFERGVTGLALDPSGKLFVYAEETVYEFAADGASITAFQPQATPDEPLASSLAVDGADYLYYVDQSGAIFKLTPGGRFLGQVLAESLEGPAVRIGIDPATREFYVTRPIGKVEHFPASCDRVGVPCSPSDTFGLGKLSGPEGVAIDAGTGTAYVADTGHKHVTVFSAQPYLPNGSVTAQLSSPTSVKFNGVADPQGAGQITSCDVEYAPSSTFNALQTLTISGATGGTFNLAFHPNEQTVEIPYNATAPELQGTIGTRAGNGNVAVSGPAGGPYTIEFVGALAETPVTQMVPSGALLTPAGATISVETANPGGEGWPFSTASQCEPLPPYTNPAQTEITAEATGLEAGTGYHYRLGLENAEGSFTSYEQIFVTLPTKPTISAESISDVHADTATVHAQINPGGGESTYLTSYHVQYVTQQQFEKSEEEGEEGFAAAASSPSFDAGSAKAPQDLTAALSGLPSGTIFRYRVLASNECEVAVQCTTIGATRSFATLPFLKEPNEPCSNAHVRQQSGSASLLDCRAYELASAPDTAGYDVESDLVPGQTPFGAPAEAEGSLLYGVHDGGIPGAGEPTNRGVDPYVATRTPEGWITEYVGIPAGGTSSKAPFGSPVLEVDSTLATFAFGGSGICSPCFGPGQTETGEPIHLSNGELVQGMAGSIAQPAAKPEGFIGKHLSADGSHFVFGSKSKFEPDANEGELTIYDRNLTSKETHVVSETPSGETMEEEGKEIGELDISKDGSRIVIGHLVEEVGNAKYWHLYMNIGDSGETIDLTPGATHGVLFDGMTEDGSKVFFTTSDQLPGGGDTDASADIYEAEVSGAAVTLTRISTGVGAGNTDLCEPVPNSGRTHWNTVGSNDNCDAVAIGGSGGVANGIGAIYFLSPEKLEVGSGVQNQPNLYLAVPGSAPRFVATLEPNNPLVLDAVSEAGVRHTADFQTTPDGGFAVFSSALALAEQGEETEAYAQIYRYDSIAPGLACASCTPSGEPSTAAAALAQNGRSLTDDGRVFFTTPGRLAAADTDGVKDVYEWEPQGTGNCQPANANFSPRSDDCLALVSAGTSAVDSGLLGVSAKGKDAFFFTRDSLVPQDKNGPTMKIYDAREEGGIPYFPVAAECKASDECHGAASLAPPPLSISSESGTSHNYEQEKRKPCKKGLVLKHGHCVRKHHRKHHRGGRR